MKGKVVIGNRYTIPLHIPFYIHVRVHVYSISRLVTKATPSTALPRATLLSTLIRLSFPIHQLNSIHLQKFQTRSPPIIHTYIAYLYTPFHHPKKKKKEEEKNILPEPKKRNDSDPSSLLTLPYPTLSYHRKKEKKKERKGSPDTFSSPPTYPPSFSSSSPSLLFSSSLILLSFAEIKRRVGV